MAHPSSAEVAARIEELYGAPLNELEAHVQGRPPGMLTALLAGHHTLAFAEQSITVHRERLQQLVHPERQSHAFEVAHILDCARRLAEAVAVRDTQSATVHAVLQSLDHTPTPEPTATPALAVPAPAVSAAGTAPGR
ncbi:hypothetical protein ACIOHE_23930 [Streptomyces sp. NPDC087851]|uniref:hypothetical protein n=1 Tax=Streptomyces sp. NPDC087851 TaxID=3365810 RepID=UPI003814E8EF